MTSEFNELTVDKVNELVESNKYFDGTNVSDMTTSDLIKARNFTVSHYYDNWCWIHFYHIINNELNSRNVLISANDSRSKSYWDDPRVLDIDPLYH